ncbi:MAG: hypothetical protein DYG89_04185 [Caldilinea sp. CFX5]|nr:hypothetical protein [Caldilinea sp. CFX5]
MTYKLLVLHNNGVISAALIIAVIDSTVQTTLVTIDPAKDRAYRTAHDDQTVSRRTYEEAVGIFEKRLIITDAHGNRSVHPADSLLLPITKHAAGAPGARAGGETRTLDLPDILAHAVAGKYVVKNKKLELNPNWQEPTILITAPNAPSTP